MFLEAECKLSWRHCTITQAAEQLLATMSHAHSSEGAPPSPTEVCTDVGEDLELSVAAVFLQAECKLSWHHCTVTQAAEQLLATMSHAHSSEGAPPSPTDDEVVCTDVGEDLELSSCLGCDVPVDGGVRVVAERAGHDVPMDEKAGLDDPVDEGEGLDVLINERVELDDQVDGAGLEGVELEGVELVDPVDKEVELVDPVDKGVELVDPVDKGVELVNPVDKEVELVDPVDKGVELVDPVDKGVELVDAEDEGAGLEGVELVDPVDKGVELVDPVDKGVELVDPVDEGVELVDPVDDWEVITLQEVLQAQSAETAGGVAISCGRILAECLVGELNNQQKGETASSALAQYLETVSAFGEECGRGKMEMESVEGGVASLHNTLSGQDRVINAWSPEDTPEVFSLALQDVSEDGIEAVDVVVSELGNADVFGSTRLLQEEQGTPPATPTPVSYASTDIHIIQEEQGTSPPTPTPVSHVSTETHLLQEERGTSPPTPTPVTHASTETYLLQEERGTSPPTPTPVTHASTDTLILQEERGTSPMPVPFSHTSSMTTPTPVSHTSSQTTLSCEDMFSRAEEMRELELVKVELHIAKSNLTTEQSQRQVAEELVKIVQADVNSLTQRNTTETMARMQAENELSNVKVCG